MYYLLIYFLSLQISFFAGTFSQNLTDQHQAVEPCKTCSGYGYTETCTNAYCYQGQCSDCLATGRCLKCFRLRTASNHADIKCNSCLDGTCLRCEGKKICLTCEGIGKLPCKVCQGSGEERIVGRTSRIIKF